MLLCLMINSNSEGDTISQMKPMTKSGNMKKFISHKKLIKLSNEELIANLLLQTKNWSTISLRILAASLIPVRN